MLAESQTAGDENSAQSVTAVDSADEQRLIRKIDLHILPFVVLLYLFSFLDRVNIGNARLYGLEEDLGLVGDQYQVAVSLLFITYCVCIATLGNIMPNELTVCSCSKYRRIWYLRS